ncbi:MAG: TIGR02444 family protein [Rhodobacteraceae bacterium]|nr:TIGR02444 family protein [Paracoccaceae bacterium]
MGDEENTYGSDAESGLSAVKNPMGFWDFSLALYATEGAPEACLRLQDDSGCDVNMALFCLWIGLMSGHSPEDILQSATSLSEEWARRAVRPLRAVRRDLKSGVEGVAWDVVRNQIKSVELAAEKAQQEALEALAFKASPPSARLGREQAAAAFNHYASLSGLTVRADTPAFQTLLAYAERVDGAGGGT